MNTIYPKYGVGSQVTFKSALENGSGMIMKIVEIGRYVFKYIIKTAFGVRCLSEDEITLLNC